MDFGQPWMDDGIVAANWQVVRSSSYLMATPSHIATVHSVWRRPHPHLCTKGVNGHKRPPCETTPKSLTWHRSCRKLGTILWHLQHHLFARLLLVVPRDDRAAALPGRLLHRVLGGGTALIKPIGTVPPFLFHNLFIIISAIFGVAIASSTEIHGFRLNRRLLSFTRVHLLQQLPPYLPQPLELFSARFLLKQQTKSIKPPRPGKTQGHQSWSMYNTFTCSNEYHLLRTGLQRNTILE